MIILDTNVISALMVPDLNPLPVSWLDKQSRIKIWTTAISVLENKAGLLLLPAGKRKTRLMESFELLIANTLDYRVLAFDQAAAYEAATLSASRKAQGRNTTTEDTQIAGIALAHRATLATRNVKDFQDLDVPVINPWEA